MNERRRKSIVNAEPETFPSAIRHASALAHQGGVYKDVRSLSRGLAIIEALGVLGWAKLSQLSLHTGIDRTTSYRLVNTLIEDGYVIRRPEDGAVALSRKLIDISQNLRSNDIVAQAVTRHLSELTQAIKWPSDFGVFSQGTLRIAASTHSQSPMSLHRAMVGNTRPLFRSALGKAFLAAISQEELRQVIDLIRSMDGPDAADARGEDAIHRAVAEVRARGYAFAVGTTEIKFSAIALPLCKDQEVIGAINVIFLRSALSVEAAAEKYLDRLRQTVGAIESRLE